MKILALDSSGLVASVAVVEDDILVAEYTMNYKKTHSQTLLPMLDEVKKAISLDLNSIDAIAVAAGPGSFTGLRIGSATAKGLGLALDKPLIGIPTVDALAYNLYDTAPDTLICPIMDARRKQVYTGIYCFDNHALKILKPQDAVPMTELIEETCHVPYSFAPAHINKQRAAAVAALAQIYYKEGKMEDAADHQPDYLRVSQAERERAARLAKEENADH